MRSFLLMFVAIDAKNTTYYILYIQYAMFNGTFGMSQENALDGFIVFR